MLEVPRSATGAVAAPPIQHFAAANPPEARRVSTVDNELWAPGEAAPIEQQVYVPVHCRVCDTRMYATAGQVGSDIKCPDCGAKTTVKMVATRSGPPPPVVSLGEGYELEEPPPALTFELVGYGRRVPSALVEARSDSTDVPGGSRPATRKRHRQAPKLWMAPSEFLYPCNRGVVGTLLLTATLLTAVYFLTRLIDVFSGELLTAVAAVFFIVIDVTLVSLALAYFSTLLVAIVEVSSDGADQVNEELELMYADRIWRMLFVVAAWVYAAAPGMLLDLAAGSPDFWRWKLGIAVVAPGVISWFLLLPVTQLSVLETSSLAAPISFQILRSMKKSPCAWLIFYSVSGFLAACNAVAAALLVEFASPLPRVWGLMLATLFSLVIYYRLLGRLAWYLSERTRPIEKPQASSPYDPLYP